MIKPVKLCFALCPAVSWRLFLLCLMRLHLDTTWLWLINSHRTMERKKQLEAGFLRVK